MSNTGSAGARHREAQSFGLYTADGRRKYLNHAERMRALAVMNELPRESRATGHDLMRIPNPPFDLLDKLKVKPLMPGGGCAAQGYFILVLGEFYRGDDACCLDLLRKRNRHFPSSRDVSAQRARYAFEKTFTTYLPDALDLSVARTEGEALRHADAREARVWLLFKAQRVLGVDNPLAWLCRAARLIAAHCKEIDEAAAGYAAYLLAQIALFHPDEEDDFFLPLEVFHDMNGIGTPNARDAFPESEILFPGIMRRPT